MTLTNISNIIREMNMNIDNHTNIVLISLHYNATIEKNKKCKQDQMK